MKPRDNRISTTIYYKDTDSHSYLNFSSSHPSSCKSSIPYSQFLRLRKICGENDDFDIEATKMETFFVGRGYPNDLIRRGRERATTRSWAEILEGNAGNNTANDRVPLVTTFHPTNLDACKIISRNLSILHDDITTNNILRKPPLKAFRRAKNLKDLLVRAAYCATFRITQQVLSPATGPFAVHVPILIHLLQLQHPKDMLISQGISPASRTTWFIV